MFNIQNPCVRTMVISPMTTHILLLAAGSSSRMGESKQLMNVTGEPMLIAAVRSALAASPYVTVVLGSNAAVHGRLLEDFPVLLEENPDWKKGLGNSLKAGLHSIQASVPPADAVLVMLCDQPKITPAHLQQLIERGEASSKKIVASAYNNTLGVPALFKRELFKPLLEIGDDAGAGKFIRQHPDDTDVIDFPGAAIDLDTREDVNRFLDRPPGSV